MRMRKLLAVTLAGLVSIGAVAATTGAADAHSTNYYRYGYSGYGYYPGPRPPLAYLYLGTPFFGLGVRTPYFFGWHRAHEWNEHVAWCSARYRTYNPATDSYFIRRGVPARCISPDMR